MELLYVYEDKVAEDAQGNLYTGSAFSQEVFDRYLEHFDSITMLMRKAPIDPNDTDTLSRMNRLDTSKIRVVWLPDLMSGLKNFFSLRLRREFRRLVCENITPDRAVIIRAPSGSGAIAAKYCRKLGKPYLVEAVGCPWDSPRNHSLRGKVLAPFAWMKLRRVMRRAPYAVYVTDEFLQHRYPTNGKSAGISDVELLPADKSVLEKRLSKIAEHSGKTVIGTAGALHIAYKGQQFVFEALARLKAEGRTDFEYRLAGGGDDTRLRALAEKLGVSEQVVFCGSLPHDEMFSWLDELDVYIQPSTVEGMPRALIEAMSRALPSFGSRIGGMPELLGDAGIFHAKDSAEIAKLLSALSRDGMAEMAKANFARASDFEKEKLERRRRKFYGEFAKSAKGGQNMFFAICSRVGVSFGETFAQKFGIMGMDILASEVSEAEFKACASRLYVHYCPQFEVDDCLPDGNDFYNSNKFIDTKLGVMLVRDGENGFSLYANQDCPEWFMTSLELTLLKAGITFAHSAALEKDGSALFLPARGGVGKTATVVNMVRQQGWRLLGDDLIMLDGRTNFVYPYHKQFVIYGYHKNLFPELFSAGKGPVRNQSLNHAMTKMIPTAKKILRLMPGMLAYARQHNPQQIRVYPKDIFEKEQLSGGAKDIQRTIWLERCSGDEVIYRPCTEEEIASRCAGVTLSELTYGSMNFNDRLFVMCGSGMLDFAEIYNNVYNIILSSIHSTDPHVLSVPQALPVESVSEYVLKYAGACVKE